MELAFNRFYHGPDWRAERSSIVQMLDLLDQLRELTTMPLELIRTPEEAHALSEDEVMEILAGICLDLGGISGLVLTDFSVRQASLPSRWQIAELRVLTVQLAALGSQGRIPLQAFAKIAERGERIRFLLQQLDC
jgi:hypothetical protein